MNTNKLKIIKQLTYNSYNRSHYVKWTFPGPYDLSLRFYFITPKSKTKFIRKFTLKSHKDKIEYIISQNEFKKLLALTHNAQPQEVISRINPITKKFERIILDLNGSITEVIESRKDKVESTTKLK